MLEVEKVNVSKIHNQFTETNKINSLAPQDALSDELNKITHFSLQFYGEHCTECAAPDCHSSCNLYSKGPTIRCRRFLGGILAKNNSVLPLNYTFDIIFKPWGRLLTLGNTLLHERKSFSKKQSLLIWSGYLWQKIKLLFSFLPDRKFWIVGDKLTGLGNKVPLILNSFSKKRNTPLVSDLLLLIGNPNEQEINVEIIVSQLPPTGLNFRRSFTLKKGWNEKYYPKLDIELTVDLNKPFRMTLVPLIEQETYLQIAYYGFVSKAALPSKNNLSNKTTVNIQIKLLIIDLDNTLWDGVLIEDISASRKLKPGIENVLKTLDSRGILLSISSKNNLSDAKKALEELGVWGLFIYPQINWEPKSINIQKIVNNINIGMDTVAFIDDSIFEREQVAQSNDKIRLYSDDQFISLLDKVEFNPIVTTDSKNRRKYYQDENVRQSEIKISGDNYDDFLKSCQMKVELSNVNKENTERVYELIQRTNQLNFSGKKYSPKEVDKLLSQKDSIPLVISCEDKYGKYGVVGFALISYKDGNIMIEDMMLSCRILGKKVEQAILFYSLELRKKFNFINCQCVFKPTERNLPAKNVLIDFGVEFEQGKERVNLINDKTTDKKITDLPLVLQDKTDTYFTIKNNINYITFKEQSDDSSLYHNEVD